MRALNSQEIAKHLITELIRAGYLPNNTLPEYKIDEISEVIKKYLHLRDYSAQSLKGRSIEQKNTILRWIIAIAASDIEDRLGRNKVDLAVIDHIYEILANNIELPDNSPHIEDREIQIYIGIHRNMLKFDNEMLSYILFRYYIENWADADDNTIKQTAADIVDLKEIIDAQINHPFTGQLNRLIKRYAVFFSILVDVISENPEKSYEALRLDHGEFARMVKEVCDKRYKQARAKLWRAGLRSILYIFITKSFFVLLLEIPAIKFFGEDVNVLSLAINISFPAVLLFLIIFFTRIPGADNTQKILEGIEEIAYIEKERNEPFKFRKAGKRGGIMNTTFGLFYIVTFFISFGAVVWALDKIHFTWVSTIIFLFFLAFVSFFSIRIRKSAKELYVIKQKENILGFFADFFYLPIIVVGKWLSEKFSRINVFVFVLDFIIEAPFKIFVEITEEWTKYVKERKENIE